MKENRIPRRAYITKMTCGELAIHKAIEEVEKMGAHPKLTDTIIELNNIKNKLSDFVESTEFKIIHAVTENSVLTGDKMPPCEVAIPFGWYEVSVGEPLTYGDRMLNKGQWRLLSMDAVSAGVPVLKGEIIIRKL